MTQKKSLGMFLVAHIIIRRNLLDDLWWWLHDNQTSLCSNIPNEFCSSLWLS